MIESPDQIVGDRLNVKFAKAGEDLRSSIGLTVAVFVFQIPHVRSGCDKDATSINSDAGGPRKVTSKDLAFVEDAVVVCVFKKSHFTDRQVTGSFHVWLVSGFVGVRVVVHFDNIESSIFIECSRNGIGHQRFRSDQLHGEPVLQRKGRGSVLGLNGLTTRQRGAFV